MAELEHSDTNNAPAPHPSVEPPSSMYAVKSIFVGDYTEVRGVILLAVDTARRKLDRIFCVIVPDSGSFGFQLDSGWKAFEDAIISSKLSGNTAHQMSMEVQKYLKRAIQDEIIDDLILAVEHNSEGEIARQLEDVISRAIADANVVVKVSLERIEAKEITEDEPDEDSGENTPEVETAPAGMPAGILRREVKVDPVLSPVHGVAVSDLKPGMVLVVSIRETGVVGENLKRLLSTRAADDSGHFEAPVISLEDSTQSDRCVIKARLAESITGVTTLSGELRVKVTGKSAPVPDEMAKPEFETTIGLKKGVSTKHFAILSFLVFTILAFLAYLVFGGKI